MKAERNAAIIAARRSLESRAAEPKEICAVIVGIGKPYDAEVIRSHAALVATYLVHDDNVVRHQAIWFLGSWGHLPEYTSRIDYTANMDPDVYNRAYAAKSLGSILKHAKDASVTRSLLAFVEDEQEETEVRLSAYSGLLYAWNRADSLAFLIGDKAISDVDREFLNQLHAWTQGQGEMPHVTPPRGLFHSLFQALKTGHLIQFNRRRA